MSSAELNPILLPSIYSVRNLDDEPDRIKLTALSIGYLFFIFLLKDFLSTLDIQEWYDSLKTLDQLSFL